MKTKESASGAVVASTYSYTPAGYDPKEKAEKQGLKVTLENKKNYVKINKFSYDNAKKIEGDFSLDVSKDSGIEGSELSFVFKDGPADGGKDISTKAGVSVKQGGFNVAAEFLRSFAAKAPQNRVNVAATYDAKPFLVGVSAAYVTGEKPATNVDVLARYESAGVIAGVKVELAGGDKEIKSDAARVLTAYAAYPIAKDVKSFTTVKTNVTGSDRFANTDVETGAATSWGSASVSAKAGWVGKEAKLSLSYAEKVNDYATVTLLAETNVQEYLKANANFKVAAKVSLLC